MADLPKTFRDAVTITRNLGIRYLWIDSLCIIQDSEEDWIRESSRMGRIYRDAAVTIFAEVADGDDGGCFMPRPAGNVALCRTPMFDSLINLEISPPFTPSFVQIKSHHSGTHSKPKQHHLFERIRSLNRPRTRLQQRAWVLQETILSFRSLTYDQHEVRWHCPTSIACECLPEGHQRQSFTEDDLSLVSNSPNSIDPRELSKVWSDIVRQYVQRQLTFSKDKLPALAGLAAEVSQLKNSTYLAGLWQDDLRENLAWSIPPLNSKPYEQLTTRPITYRAPSWSWASIDGQINTVRKYVEAADGDVNYTKETRPYPIWWYPTTRVNNLLCTIVSCQTTPSSELNPFGEVQSGVLVLRGHLVHGQCGPLESNRWFVDRITVYDMRLGKQEQEPEQKQGQQVGWFDPDLSPPFIESAMSATATTAATAYDDISFMPLLNDGSRLLCIALAPSSPLSAESPAPASSGPLVTTRSDPMSPQCTYTRIGIVWIRWPPRFPSDALEQVFKNLEGPESFTKHAVNTNDELTEWLESTPVTTVTVI